MPKTTNEDLRDAYEALVRAFLEYEEAAKKYDTILDRISGGVPPAGDVQTLDQRISDAYYRMWRAAEDVDRKMGDLRRTKAKFDAEMKARAAAFHGVRRPWLRPPIQRRLPLTPFTPTATAPPVSPPRPSGFGPFSFMIPFNW